MKAAEPILIVAHGQPSDPAPAEAILAQLAVAVSALLPGRKVGSATLAAPGALAAALAAAGAVDWRVLEPFGCLEAVQELAVQVAVETGAAEVILAAHGSFKSPVPAAIAGRVAGMLAAKGLRVGCGFIDQEPRLAGLSGFGAGAVCLPFFAAGGGHVTDDIPAALAEAGFAGHILPALGLDARVPGIIADAVRAGRGVCEGACRWG